MECGAASYYLVPATGSQIFSWGQNKIGQLGLGCENKSQCSPQIIRSLLGVPFAQIAAGGAHSFALTLSGAVFGWGRNKFGQLGLNDESVHVRVRCASNVCLVQKIRQRPKSKVVANVHQMALERRVGPVLDSQVCSPDCPEGLSCRNTAQYPANCSVRFLSPLANN
ncbi:UNVERIFIED_CONTAM: hypothetical protein FKN15_037185 [Acipenser sinensis]